MNHSSLKYIALATLVLVGSFAGSLLLMQARAFTQPSEPPPGGNVPTPINVSATPQTKAGPLTVAGDVTAVKFCAKDNPTLCVDPSGISNLAGNIDLGGVGRVLGYPASYVPLNPGDLATKAYVDSKIPPPPSGGQKRVFVSSQRYTGNMSKQFGESLSGLALANNRCQSLADAANFGGQWRAWLSTSTTDAKTNVDCRSDKEYWRLDASRLIARNCADLTDGLLASSIYLDEKFIGHGAGDSTANTWTGTAATGNKLTGTCDNWMDNTSDFSGVFGRAYDQNGYWTNISSGGCTNSFRIYCFEL